MTDHFTNFYSSSDKDEVQIAGNFNDWNPEFLYFDPILNKKVFKLQDQEEKGKYVFKFVINGNWEISQDYPTGKYELILL